MSHGKRFNKNLFIKSKKNEELHTTRKTSNIDHCFELIWTDDRPESEEISIESVRWIGRVHTRLWLDQNLLRPSYVEQRLVVHAKKTQSVT